MMASDTSGAQVPKGSEQEQLGAIFLSIRQKLSRVVARIVPPKDIEDIVQETYVRVCQSSGRKDIRSPESFMVQAARNLAFDHIRRHEYRFAVSVEDSPATGYGEAEQGFDEPFEQSASDEEFAEFCEAVRLLPVQCRRVFVLKKVYGYSQREIARELGITESTAEKHVSLGIRRCTEYKMSKQGTGTHKGARRSGAHS
jgi:RNA polymerase sigma-70 factor (ECF subfamily)